MNYNHLFDSAFFNAEFGLNHDFKKFDNVIANNISKNPVASDHRTMAAPIELQAQYETFLKIYKELKADFEKFLAKTY